jgi:hypothetical protein
VALGLAAGAVLVVQAMARSSASYDFADAPDGVNAGYADRPDAVGRFPSKAASGGPRHLGSGPRLGRSWSAEPASRQVDRDGDDGAELKPRSCAMSTLTLPIDASRVEPDGPIRVNAWFDWNQDGDWADGGTRTCGPEWSIQNVELDLSKLGEGGVGVVTLRFRAGKVPRQFWWRVQIQQGSTPVPHSAGGGQTAPTVGETEDWLYGRTPASSPSLLCSPALAIMAHGGVHDIDFRLVGTSPDLRLLGWGIGVTGAADGIITRWRAIPNGRRIRVVSTKRHDRKPVMQAFRLYVVVDAKVDGRRRTGAFRTGCNVTVVHGGGPIFPPFEPPKQLTPAITAPPVRVVVNPDKPNPQAARCGGQVSDRLAYFSVRVVCKGVDVKSTSIHYSTEPATQWAGPGEAAGARWLQRCGPYPGLTGFKCWWRAGNARSVLEHRVEPPATGQTTITLHVLAGGRSETGTVIVLRQVWYARGGGQFICTQSVPYAKPCSGTG